MALAIGIEEIPDLAFLLVRHRPGGRQDILAQNGRHGDAERQHVLWPGPAVQHVHVGREAASERDGVVEHSFAFAVAANRNEYPTYGHGCLPYRSAPRFLSR
jgi:hypothetical protein